ncbi:MAG: DUF3999 domain-containing protein [Lentisphaerae bacterium]|nr:DUF3999 domain-containing protein [Lentisphaerota bacterium]
MGHSKLNGERFRPPRSPIPPLVVLLLVAFAAHAAKPADFQFTRPLLPPAEGSAATVAAAELDESVLAATDDAYANLRLFNPNGTEVPGVVRPRRRASTSTRDYAIGFVQDRFRLLADNRLEFVIHRTNALDVPIAVDFDTPLDNFEKQVTVAASPDGTNWTTLTEAQPIFDYARFMAVRHLRVEFPPASQPFYRIEIGNISEARQSPLTQIERDQRGGAVFSEVERSSFQRQDFRIDRVRLLGRRAVIEQRELLKRAYAVADVLIKDDATTRATTITFTAARAPLTDIILECTTPNFSRTVTVEGNRESPPHWAFIASDSLSRVQVGRVRQEDLTLTLPGLARYREFRLTIQNLDSPPLVIDRILARGETHELVFFPERGATYQLYYGGEGASLPQYDVRAMLMDADTADAAAFTLGPQADNPAFSRSGGWWNTRGMLIAAVVAVVAALGWALAGAVKQVEA